MDGNPSLPDVERLDRMRRKLTPLEDHVVSARTEDGRQHHDRQQIGDHRRIKTTRATKLGGEPQSHQHSHGNQEPVPAQRDRTGEHLSRGGEQQARRGEAWQ